MAKFFRFFIFISFTFVIVSCSFKDPAGFFEDRLKQLEEEIARKNSQLVFTEQKKFRKEILGDISDKIPESKINKGWIQKNFGSNNYVPHLSYKNKKQLVYKSKKIGKNKFNIENLSFEPLLLEDNIFFFDSSGNIYNFSVAQEELIWKFNFYKKRYKKIPINIKLKISNENLIIADNLGYLYSLKISSGELNWAKNYGVPFRSNMKIEDGNIFALNQDNKYYSIKEVDGEKNLSLETFPSFLKSKNQTNIVLDKDKGNVYFVTSTGEFYSINYKTGNINWLSTLFAAGKDKDSDLFFSSPIIYKEDKIFFSSSVSTYALNAKNGRTIWELPFSTDLRPIVSEKFLFLISKDGFILNLDIKTGKVLWSKDLFKTNKKFKKSKIGDINSFLLASNQILASTSKGFFLFIDYRNGKIINYTKASRRGFFSSPILVDEKIYVVDRNMKVLVFN